MRAIKQDIVEIFGFAPNDVSPVARAAWGNEQCPFIGQQCTKTNHDNSKIYGTCSVSNGIKRDFGKDIVICPNRLYAQNYTTIRNAALAVWGALNPVIVIGGTLSQLKEAAYQDGGRHIVIAFGKNSGREIGVNANGQMSMDWVLQRYERVNDQLVVRDFIGIEVQSIDITGNYRDTHQAYADFGSGIAVQSIPDSDHGLNWANVHKRLIPQIIRKGNIYQQSARCVGFYFIVPDAVYKKFEEILGVVPAATAPARDVVSVMTYSLGDAVQPGSHRALVLMRTAHYRLDDIKVAFSGNTSDSAPAQLDSLLNSIVI